MILSPYFPKFKEINALRAQAGYGFMKMNAYVHLPKRLPTFGLKKYLDGPRWARN
jgi:hypothetical protein